MSCDSAFMQTSMIEVGEAVRLSYYHWATVNHPIFRYLGNDAGGLRTKQIVGAYVKMLKGDFNRISVEIGEMIGARLGVKIVSYIFFDVHGQSTA